MSLTYRRKTLRTMSPTARTVARLAGEADSLARRLKNLVPELQALDFAEKALTTATTPPLIPWEKAAEVHVTVEPTKLTEQQAQMFVDK
jgi:hypothetical protein